MDEDVDTEELEEDFELDAMLKLDFIELESDELEDTTTLEDVTALETTLDTTVALEEVVELELLPAPPQAVSIAKEIAIAELDIKLRIMISTFL